MGGTVGTGRHALSEEVPMGFKRSEVGVIPEDWQCLRFGDAVNLLTGFPFSSSGYVDSGVLLVRGSNIKRGTLDWGDEITQYWPKITSEVAKYELRNGDLVIAMDGALVGRSYAVISNADLPSLLLQRVARIRSSQLHQDLLRFLVASDSFVNHVNSTKTHTAIPHISSEDIRSFLIAVPGSTNEQSAIAEALLDVDCFLTVLETLIAKKRAVKQAAMQQLLTGKTRLPGFRGKWETKRLGDLGPLSKGRGIKREDVSFEGLPCVRYGELYTRYHNYILMAESRIPPSVALTALPIKNGDLLFAGSGETAEEIGRCAAYLGKEQGYAGGDIIVLTLSEQSLVYFGHLMNHPTVAVQKARMGQGNAIVHISARNLAQIEVELPSLKEQSAIAAILADMDAEIIALELRRDKARAIKQGMMQQLLTGRVRLVKPDSRSLGGCKVTFKL